MKLKAVFITAAASLIIASTADAQLGWTLEQCRAKFGDPTETEHLVPDGHLRLTFTSGVFEVSVTFSPKDQVSWALYQFKDPTLASKIIHDKAPTGSEDLITIVAPCSTELSSWYQWLGVGTADRGTYLGFTWKEINLEGNDVSVGYKNGQPVMTAYGDGYSVQLEATNAKDLQDQIDGKY